MWPRGASALGSRSLVEGWRSYGQDVHLIKYLCPWCKIEPRVLDDMYDHIMEEHPDNFDYRLKTELRRSHNVSVEEDD